MDVEDQQVTHNVTNVGGYGQNGLPLGGGAGRTTAEVALRDSWRRKATQVLQGEMPFLKHNARGISRQILPNRDQRATHLTAMDGQPLHAMIALGIPTDESLNPKTTVNRSRACHICASTDVRIFSMAFGAAMDDTCDFLSYKLGKHSTIHGKRILYAAEFTHEPTFDTKEDLAVLRDAVIISASLAPMCHGFCPRY